VNGAKAGHDIAKRSYISIVEAVAHKDNVDLWYLMES
jgi:hypothetical protein